MTDRARARLSNSAIEFDDESDEGIAISGRYRRGIQVSLLCAVFHTLEVIEKIIRIDSHPLSENLERMIQSLIEMHGEIEDHDK
jgi:hypothetical protein